MATSKQTTTVKAPSFNATGKRIATAYTRFDLASSRLVSDLSLAFQSYIDTCTIEGLVRNEDSCKAIRKAIAVSCDEGSGALATAVATGLIERKTIVEYAQSAQRAFFHNVPWSPTLKNDPAYGLPWGKAKATKEGVATEAKKAGAVVSTTLKDAHATLMKAIEQYRMLNQRDFANELGSVASDHYDDFKFESKSE